MRKRILSLGASVALLGSVMAALPAEAATQTPIVTPVRAKAIAAYWVATTSKGENSYNTKLLATMSGGVSFVLEHAWLHIGRRVGLPRPIPFKAVGLQVFVPRQTIYPAMFVATYHPQDQGYPVDNGTVVQLFEREKPSVAWRVTYSTYQRHGDVGPHFAVGKDGYIPVFNPVGLVVSPKHLKDKWMTVENAAVRQHPVSTEWTRNKALVDYIHTAGVHPSITTEHNVVTDTDYVTRCVAAVGGAFCFLASARNYWLWVKPGDREHGWRLVVATPEQRFYWGGIPAGNDYGMLDQRSLLEVGAFLPAAHSGQRFQLMSVSGGPISGEAM